MISFKSKTNFTKTLNRLKRYQEISVDDILRKYGEMGVKALAAATPKRTGMTAESWGYKIVHREMAYLLFGQTLTPLMECLSRY